VPSGGDVPPNVIISGFTGITIVTLRESPLVFVAVNVYELLRSTVVGVPVRRYVVELTDTNERPGGNDVAVILDITAVEK
jgi:hypothetical protein